MFLPITVNGEDVIIDYFNKELVFPNRNDDNSFDIAQATHISLYLKEEGFLEWADVEKVD